MMVLYTKVTKYTRTGKRLAIVEISNLYEMFLPHAEILEGRKVTRPAYPIHVQMNSKCSKVCNWQPHELETW